MTSATLLERSEQYLASAKLLLEHGDHESSVSRAYYATFFAAEAALATKQLAFNSHRGVIAAFGEHFVKNGPFPRGMARDLARAMDKRLLADYDAERTMTRADAEDLVIAARAFVLAVRGIL